MLNLRYYLDCPTLFDTLIEEGLTNEVYRINVYLYELIIPICPPLAPMTVLSIQQVLENKVEKKKIYKNKPSRLAISYFRQMLSIIKAKVWPLKMFIGVLNDIFKNADQGKLLYVQ